MPEDAFIVTKTDAKGRITYANRLFLAISGYSEADLLERQHNIVRHPDMPRGLFQLMWDTLKSGHEFNAYIKNLRKDGGFYWVFANVTPSLSPRGELLGYYSVRRKARQEPVRSIQKLYSRMLAEEAKAGAKGAIDASLALLNDEISAQNLDYDHYILTL